MRLKLRVNPLSFHRMGQRVVPTFAAVTPLAGAAGRQGAAPDGGNTSTLLPLGLTWRDCIAKRARCYVARVNGISAALEPDREAACLEPTRMRIRAAEGGTLATPDGCPVCKGFARFDLASPFEGAGRLSPIPRIGRSVRCRNNRRLFARPLVFPEPPVCPDWRSVSRARFICARGSYRRSRTRSRRRSKAQARAARQYTGSHIRLPARPADKCSL